MDVCVSNSKTSATLPKIRRRRDLIAGRAVAGYPAADTKSVPLQPITEQNMRGTGSAAELFLK
jgi:hypothetical protein